MLHFGSDVWKIALKKSRLKCHNRKSCITFGPPKQQATELQYPTANTMEYQKFRCFVSRLSHGSVNAFALNGQFLIKKITSNVKFSPFFCSNREPLSVNGIDATTNALLRCLYDREWRCLHQRNKSKRDSHWRFSKHSCVRRMNWTDIPLSNDRRGAQMLAGEKKRYKKNSWNHSMDSTK